MRARARLTGSRLAINLLMVVAMVTYVIGVTAPMLTLTKLVFVKNTFSVLSGVANLYAREEYLLCVVIVVFSLVLPLVKLGLLIRIWNAGHPPRPNDHRRLKWLGTVGKWSMLDVFVVAILVASVKLGALAKVEILYGWYAFAASVLLIMLTTYLVQERMRAFS